MGGGGQQTEAGSGRDAGVYTWEEVQKHRSRSDQWLVINRKVYNVTQWAKRHPGGLRVLSHYAGEDATFCSHPGCSEQWLHQPGSMICDFEAYQSHYTRDHFFNVYGYQEAFTAFHPDQKFVQKYMKPLLLGELAATEPSQDSNKNSAIIQDFDAIRVQAEKDGLFQAQPLFFCLHLGHILLLEALAWLTVWFFGTSWIPTLLCAVMLSTAQAQAGWLQHDFGHLSVFRKSKWNHLVHKFVIGHLKGASANWWNHRHFQHHAKPNVYTKDPDINTMELFVLGAIQSVEYGTKKIKHMPYNLQHRYFFLVGPPLLIPVFYNFNIIKTLITRRDWVDLAWWMTFYFRFFYSYIPLYGLLGSLALTTLVRFLESHWFMWVTQMSHLPMEMDHEKRQDWLSSQLQATCNIEQSFFNDWFSGHLNFQIEHHLFPRMPRHNYHLVAPKIHAVCEKHGVPYRVKTLWQGMADIVSSLKASGDLWLDAYLHK